MLIVKRTHVCVLVPRETLTIQNEHLYVFYAW